MANKRALLPAVAAPGHEAGWGRPSEAHAMPQRPPPTRSLRPAALCLLGLLLPAAALGGALCGTVRDGATGAPVAAAGVFLRHAAGDYTGLHAATDSAGHFCIGDVPAGTYDLEVRHDDYLVAYLRGVTVTDAATGVDVVVGGPTMLRAPFPNPARGTVTLAFRLAQPGPARLAVYDLRGRLVHGWESALPAGEHSQRWTFVDRDGRRAPPGAYFVRLTAGTIVQTRTLVHLPR